MPTLVLIIRTDRHVIVAKMGIVCAEVTIRQAYASIVLHGTPPPG